MEKQNKMKTIKNLWLWIASGVATILGILFLTKKYNQQKANQAATKIDDNKQKIDNIDGKIDVIEDQRDAAIQTANQTAEEVEDLKEQRNDINPTAAYTKYISDLKKYILNKTKRRGRKPKAKS
jgi:outer membrane murein-binding lipoprotein Lpp